MVSPRHLPQSLAFVGAPPLLALALAMAFPFNRPGETGSAAGIPRGASFRAATQWTSNDNPAGEPTRPALCPRTPGTCPNLFLKDAAAGETDLELGESRVSISL